MSPKSTLLIGLASLALAFGPTLSVAQDRAPFTGWNAGASLFHISGLETWDDDVGFNARVGYLFAPEGKTVRHGPGLDFAYATFDGEEMGVTGELDFTSLLVNYQVGAALSDQWRLFGGAGFGIGWVDIEVDGVGSFDDSAPAWQIFFGVEYKPFDVVSFRAGYRHLWVDDLSDQGFELEGDDASILEVGVTFWF